MDMLYYIYIGNDRSTINHLSKVTGGMFMAVSSSNKAAKVIDSIRERYNTSILYEQNEPLKDSQDISFLHKRFPRVYIILITPGLQTEIRKVYFYKSLFFFILINFYSLQGSSTSFFFTSTKIISSPT